QTGWCIVADPKGRAGGKPFGSPIQVIKLGSHRDEILMIVARGENDFIEVPIDVQLGQIVPAGELAHVVEIEERLVRTRERVEEQALLIRELLVQFDSKITREDIERQF